MWKPKLDLSFCRKYYGNLVNVEISYDSTRYSYIGNLLNISDRNVDGHYTITIKIPTSTGTNVIVSNLISEIKVDITKFTHKKLKYASEEILKNTNSDMISEIEQFLKKDYIAL